MKPMVFINLPVKDLKKSMDFYTKLGFINNPAFTDETAAAMAFSEEIVVMLLTHDKFKQFTTKKMTDTTSEIAVINALGLESPERVHAFADAAIANGGKQHIETKDYGFMIQRSVEDPDGHVWEASYMDMSKFPS